MKIRIKEIYDNIDICSERTYFVVQIKPYFFSNWYNLQLVNEGVLLCRVCKIEPATYHDWRTSISEFNNATIFDRKKDAYKMANAYKFAKTERVKSIEYL